MTSHRRRIPFRRPGFSLIELLVVIVIIGILITLLFTAGGALVGGQRRNVTQSLLTTLDRSLEEFLSSNRGVNPVYDPEQYAEMPGPHYRGTDEAMTEDKFGQDTGIHAYNSEPHVRWPDASVFIRQTSPFGEVSGILSQIPESFQTLTLGDEDTSAANDPNRTPSILDGWRNPNWASPWPIAEQQLIYYVHPKNHLAQALYGRCQNQRPYFFSAGPDLLYGTTTEFNVSDMPATSPTFAEDAVDALEDNIYSYDVNPLETANLTSEFNQSDR